jgi:hypothetical protein
MDTGLLDGYGVDGKVIIKKDLKEEDCKGMHWITVAQGRYNWQAVVNTEIKLPQTCLS